MNQNIYDLTDTVMCKHAKSNELTVNANLLKFDKL